MSKALRRLQAELMQTTQRLWEWTDKLCSTYHGRCTRLLYCQQFQYNSFWLQAEFCLLSEYSIFVFSNYSAFSGVYRHTVGKFIFCRKAELVYWTDFDFRIRIACNLFCKSDCRNAQIFQVSVGGLVVVCIYRKCRCDVIVVLLAESIRLFSVFVKRCWWGETSHTEGSNYNKKGNKNIFHENFIRLSSAYSTRR